MDFFDLPVYRWRAKMEKLLSNVALAKIAKDEAEDISFSFINMVNGKHCNTLKCADIIKSSCESPSSLELPTFIGEVYCVKITKDEMAKTFSYFNVGENSINDDDCYLLSIEGGEVDIDILCKEYCLVE